MAAEIVAGEGYLASAGLIGIDVGTTSVKAVLVTTEGMVLDRFARAHATRRPRPGWAEQDPSDWIDAVLAALGQFAGLAEVVDVLGIGLCSQVNTHVFVDAEGAPLMPAILWQDGRCASEAARLDAEIGVERKLEWFGAPVPIDASHALSRIAFVADHHPDIYASTRHVLLPKDFVVRQLTGATVADPVSAVGLTDANLAYVDELLAIVPGATERLPALFDLTDIAGTVRAGLPFAGAPVAVGAMDAWAGMFGLGVAADGEAMLQCGTSEIPGIVSARVVPTPGVVVFPPWHGITMHAAPTQSGGAALAWLGKLLGRTPDELSALAAVASPEAATPLFLPHLEGERAPLWDPESRGVFARLDSATGPQALARSVMEGVAHSVRMAFAALESSAGQGIETVNIGGGGARSDVWCAIKADVLGKTLRRVDGDDAVALGAAMLAGIGAGAFASLGEAIGRLVRYGQSFEPDPAMADYYAHRFKKYRALYEDLRAFNRGF